MRALGTLLTGLALVGCSFPGTAQMEKDRLQLQELTRQQQKTQADRPVVEIQDGFFFGVGQSIPLPEESRLPVTFHEQYTLTERPLTISQVADRITQISGVPIRLATDAAAVPGRIMLSYEGDLKTLLDVVASHFGVSWEYVNGGVELFSLKTKTFTLSALPGRINMESVITNASRAEGGGTGGTGDQSAETSQQTTVTEDVSVWDELTNNIKIMLTKDGKVVANKVSGTITVTDTPGVLHQVGEYVNQINIKMSRQVAITVKVFSLKTSNDVDLGVTLNAVFNDIDRKVGGALVGATPFNLPIGSGSLSATILDSPSNPALAQWNGSELLVQALRQHGNVSLVTSGSGLTLNNQPLPVQNVSRTSYLARASTTVVSDGTTTVELEPGVVTTGFSMSVTPNILDNNKVALHYTVTLSSLDNLKSITSAGTTIETPEVSTRSFMQRAAMPLGSTLVLAGFEQAQTRDDTAYGVFDLSRRSGARKESIIVVITVHGVAGA